VGIAVFIVVALVIAVILAYPLLPGQMAIKAVPAIEDVDIEQAVRQLRTARTRGGRFCPSCGQGYQAGDRFCVRCGGTLPGALPVANGSVCPSCGAATNAGDVFCAKCGHSLVTEEGA
jgi:uncharacterized OB-fold protein